VTDPSSVTDGRSEFIYKIRAPQLHFRRELISAMPEKPEELPCFWAVAHLFMDHFLFQLLPVET
jgi:hypothetical protein